MMRAVRQRGTAPELATGKLLRSLGTSYRKNCADLPGRPDFSNRARAWALFVHGCFWHGHRNCAKTKGGRSGRIPAANRAFWEEKIAANRKRDRAKALMLKGLGLRVGVLWECELRKPEDARRKLAKLLDLPEHTGRIGG